MKNYTIWLFGEPNSGKTTTAYNLLQDKLRNCVVLDGDVYRQKNGEYLREELIIHNNKNVNFAKDLMEKGYNVIVSCITPLEDMRIDIKKSLGDRVLLIELKADKSIREKRKSYSSSSVEFEEGKTKDIMYRTDFFSERHIKNNILNTMEMKGWIK